MPDTRIEKDSMGEMAVPASALYGASTQRAVLNFPISGYRFPREFIRALGLIKMAAARANQALGKLDAARADLIAQAAAEVSAGVLDEHFPVDIFQTGSGTSTNMNANEVIANRCSQIAGRPIGSRDPVHPNDHVNMGQSSNDVIPTAIHVATAESLKTLLLPALQRLEAALRRKSGEFWDVIKIGRTHLMDATPVRLGQEFAGYAKQVEYGTPARRQRHQRHRGTRPRRHRRRHRPQRPPGIRPPRHRLHRRRDRASISAKPPTTSRPRARRMASSRRAASSRPSPSASSRSPTTSAGSAAARGAASAKFSFRPPSPAPRSCPARSTR